MPKKKRTPDDFDSRWKDALQRAEKRGLTREGGA
jgi:hypothetical protein